MKITVSCKICGRIISEVDKPEVSQEDLDEYDANSSCEIDGPFQQYDDNGDPLPLDNSNIVVMKTLD